LVKELANTYVPATMASSFTARSISLYQKSIDTSAIF
jgi:hypothetical protein